MKLYGKCRNRMFLRGPRMVTTNFSYLRTAALILVCLSTLGVANSDNAAHDNANPSQAPGAEVFGVPGAGIQAPEGRTPPGRLVGNAQPKPDSVKHQTIAITKPHRDSRRICPFGAAQDRLCRLTLRRCNAVFGLKTAF